MCGPARADDDEPPVCLAERTAVFDLSNPADERYLEQLSVIFAHAHE
jgi:hypothetical protein